MKHFLFTLTLLSVVFTNAQSKESYMGLKGGLNFSTFSGSEGVDLSRRISFHMGLMLESKLSEQISLQPEILFSSQGTNADLGSEDIENRLNYVNLPILLKFYVSDKFSFDIGPQLGVLVSAKQSSTSRHDIDIKSNYSDTDISLSTGISYKFVSGLSFSTRYNFGLKNLINTNLYSNEDKLKNGVFNLSIGYYFKK